MNRNLLIALTACALPPAAAVAGPGLHTWVGTAPFEDDCSGAAGTQLNGHAVGGVTWVQDKGGSTNTTSLTYDGSGHCGGSTAAGASSAFGYIAPPNMNEWWVRRTFAPNTAFDSSARSGLALARDHIANVLGNFDSIPEYCAAGTCANDTLTSFSLGGVNRGNANAIGSGSLSVSNVTFEAGDVFEVTYLYSGGSLIETPYLNGRQIKTGVAIPASLAPSGQFGMRGDLLTGLLDDFMVGDPKLNCMVRLDAPYRVVQLNADGSLDQTLQGDYTCRAPKAMAFSFQNAATEATVTGYASQPLTGFTASGGRWSGIAHIAAADVPSTFRFRAERTDGVQGAAIVYAWSPVLRPGALLGCSGQSLCALMLTSSAAGPAVASVATYWEVNGGTDGAWGTSTSVFPDRRTNHPTSTKDTGIAMDAVHAGGGPTYASFLMCGHGNSPIRDRLLGGPYGELESCREGWGRAGGFFRVWADYSGHYETQVDASSDGAMGSTERLTFKQAFRDQYAQLKAVNQGRDFLYAITVMGSLGYNINRDQRAMDLRRAQMEVIRESAQNLEGAAALELQHDGELYHLEGTDAHGWGEAARRLGHVAAKALGYETCDRNGGVIEGLNRVDDHTLEVLIDTRCATASPEAFVAASNDYRLGLTYSIGDHGALFPCTASVARPFGAADTTACTFLAVPNALPTFTQISGQHWKMTAVFAASTFPATACVQGPWGEDPYGRPWSGGNQAKFYNGGDATVDATMVTLAARIRFNYGDAVGDKPPLDYYFNPSFTADSSHDYFCAS